MNETFVNIPLEDLCLDLYNPRLPKSKQGKDENTIIEYLLLEASTLELMESIGENDFFVGEMLLVIPNGQGKYIVVEGNRRLTAVKLLNDPTLAKVKKVATKEVAEVAKYKPVELPCLLFSTREDIQKFIGFVHITGKKSWRMLEKARYLHDIRNGEAFVGMPLSNACKEIARMIGSKAPYVKKMLISYQLYEIIEDENFYQIEDLSDSTFFLNYFSDGLQKEHIRAYLNVDLYSDTPLVNLHTEHLKELIFWWFKKTEGVSRVIGDSEGMKMLNEVLGNEIALKAFKDGFTIFAAYELTNDIDLQFENKVKEALSAIEQADRLSNRAKQFYKELTEDLKTISQIAYKINGFKNQREASQDGF